MTKFVENLRWVAVGTLCSLACFVPISPAAASNWVATWDQTTTGLNTLYPYGIAFSSNAYVYVSEQNSSVVHKFTTTGIVVDTLGNEPGNDLDFPKGLDIDSDGRIYVAAENRIHIYNSAGVHVADWGGTAPDTANGKFNKPHDVAIGAGDTVYVADHTNFRIQVFDRNGNFIRKWGTSGNGPGEFQGPSCIALDINGNVYVGDDLRSDIQKFTRTGTLLAAWGGPGTGPGKFSRPFGIAVDASGYVYISDFDLDRIQVFDGVGTYLSQWGSQGTANGQFDLPIGVGVDANGYIFVADKGNQRVQKFGPGITAVAPGGELSGLRFEPPVPNPSINQATLRFSLPQASGTSLVLYDLSGRRVTEWQWSNLTAGPHQVTWSGRDEKGQSVAAGTYVSRLTVNGQSQSQKLVLVR